MRPLVSVVVPVYNVEKYVEQCLNSLINQTLSNIEIIVVDDGSTDNSAAICHRIAELDSRIRVISKKNGGLSDARNYGMKYVTSDYVGFIDSDDYVDPNFYEVLYNKIKGSNVQVAVAQIKKTDNQGELLFKAGYHCNGVLSAEEALESMLSAKGISNSVCNKLFDFKLFSNMKFPIGKLYEDEYVTYKIIDSCKGIYFTNETSYYYRVNQQSITNQPFSEKEMDRIEASIIRIAYLEEKHPALTELGKCYLMYDCLTAISKMYKFEDKYNKLLSSNIRNCFLAYLRGHSSLGAKGFAVLAFISPRLACSMYNVFAAKGKRE